MLIRRATASVYTVVVLVHHSNFVKIRSINAQMDNMILYILQPCI